MLPFRFAFLIAATALLNCLNFNGPYITVRPIARSNAHDSFETLKNLFTSFEYFCSSTPIFIQHRDGFYRWGRFSITRFFCVSVFFCNFSPARPPFTVRIAIYTNFVFRQMPADACTCCYVLKTIFTVSISWLEYQVLAGPTPPHLHLPLRRCASFFINRPHKKCASHCEDRHLPVVLNILEGWVCTPSSAHIVNAITPMPFDDGVKLKHTFLLCKHQCVVFLYVFRVCVGLTGTEKLHLWEFSHNRATCIRFIYVLC